MGDNTLQTVIPGPSAPNDINQFKTALSGNILPRNVQGETENKAGSLGSATKSFDSIYVETINSGGTQGGFCPAGVMLPYTASATVAPFGWIFADGKTIGDTGSGADYEGEKYRYLFSLYKLVVSYGNAGTEDFDTGDTVKIPHPNGRVVRSIGTEDTSGSGLGDTVASQTKAHSHVVSDSAGIPLYNDNGGSSISGPTIQLSSLESGSAISGSSHRITAVTAGSTEARSRSMFFPYIIKV